MKNKSHVPEGIINLNNLPDTGNLISDLPLFNSPKIKNVSNKKKAKQLYKKALNNFIDGNYKKAYKQLAKAITLDPKTKKYFIKGDLENIFI